MPTTRDFMYYIQLEPPRIIHKPPDFMNYIQLEVSTWRLPLLAFLTPTIKIRRAIHCKFHLNEQHKLVFFCWDWAGSNFFVTDEDRGITYFVIWCLNAFHPTCNWVAAQTNFRINTQPLKMHKMDALVSTRLACWGLAATWPGLKIQFGMGSNFGSDVKTNVRNLKLMVQFKLVLLVPTSG